MAISVNRIIVQNGAVGGDNIQHMKDSLVAIDDAGLVVFLGDGLPYGCLYVHEGAVSVDVLNGSYVKIGTGSELTTGLLNNVSINSDAFRVGAVGVYKVNYQISASSVAGNVAYEFDIFVNGVEQPQGSSRRKFGTAADNGSLSGAAIVSVTDVAHDIDLRVKGVGTASDITVLNLNFNLFQVGGPV